MVSSDASGCGVLESNHSDDSELKPGKLMFVDEFLLLQ